MAGTTDTDEESFYTSEEKNWAAIAHLSAFSGMIIPFGHILGPLIVWLVKRGDSELVGEEAKEALNCQISVTVYLLLCIPAAFIVIGGFLFGIILIMDFVLIIVAAIHASKAESYNYPFIFRLIN